MKQITYFILAQQSEDSAFDWAFDSLCRNQELRVVSNLEALIHSEKLKPFVPCQRIGEIHLKYEHYAVKNANEMNI
jgi:hypothetical protein